MIDTLWKAESKITVADISAEVGCFEWPQPVETSACSPAHGLSLSLSPRPAHSQLRYDSAGAYDDVGDLLFLPASMPFRGRSDGGRQRLLQCRFSDGRLACLRKSGRSWNESELKAGLDLRDPRMRAQLARVAQEVISPGLASPLLIESLLTTALVDLARYLDRRSESRPARIGILAPWQMRRVRERVASAERMPPSATELAALCGISTRHLMRGFKNASGMTLHHYVEEVRLERAKQLLLGTRLPLKTISWQLGFSHPSGFTAAFRRAQALTPTAFRTQSGKRAGDIDN